MILIDSLAYTYPDAKSAALDGVDLSVGQGEYLFLGGVSGSGKSTLLYALMGLASHHLGGRLTGSASVAGLDVAKVPVSKIMEKVGLVFQNPDAMLFNRTVKEEAAFGLEGLGLKPGEVAERIGWALGVAGLTDRESSPCFELSGGEKKMLSIASVLAMGPRTVLLDEPFAHLDHENSSSVGSLLAGLDREGYTLVVAEHRSWLIAHEIDRVVVLDRGRVAGDGPPRAVLSKKGLFGVEPPPITRLFIDAGLDDPPLTVSEGLSRLGELHGRSKSHLLPAFVAPGEVVAEVEDVRAGFGKKTVLDGVSLKVREGECLGVVGPNGSGKTTLIRVLAGLMEPAEGSVSIMGRQMGRIPPEERAILMGVAFQNPTLGFFNATVAKEAAAGRMLGPAEVSSLLARVNLEHAGRRSPFTLSEGEKRRLAVASALAGGGKLLLIDEPTAGLGAVSRRLLVDIVRSLLSQGLGVVAVSHDLEFLEEVSGRWLVLADGRVEREGGPDAIMADGELIKRARLRATQFHAVREALYEGGEETR